MTCWIGAEDNEPTLQCQDKNQWFDKRKRDCRFVAAYSGFFDDGDYSEGGTWLLNTPDLTNINSQRFQNSNDDQTSAGSAKGSGFSFYTFVVTFGIMCGVWVLLSGKFDPFHMSLGVISCGIVAFFSSDLLFPSQIKVGAIVGQWFRFVKYVPWLMIEIFKANLHVTYLVFHPRMMDLIDPHIVRFRSRLTGDMALVTFANSITLTPGTITVDVSIDGDFKVHAIDRASGEPLPGEMEARVAKAFGEV